MHLINNVTTETKQIIHHEQENVIQCIAQLQTTVQQLVSTTGATIKNKTPSENPSDETAACEAKLKKCFDNCDAYCWSHGFTGSSAHTTATQQPYYAINIQQRTQPPTCILNW